MIAAVLAAVAFLGCGDPPSPSRCIAIATTSTASLMMAAPPCGTPEAAKSDRCIRWELRPDNPMAIGYERPIPAMCDSAPDCPGWTEDDRVFYRRFLRAYLDTGQGLALPMNGGRCSYSTGWNGKMYADQDFTLGPGVGQPRNGAKPC